MRAVLHRLLARYGQTVTLEREQPEEVRAFLQPLSGRDETVPDQAVSLGMLDGRRWMYLGAAEVAVGEVLRWGELSLRVRSVRPHAVGGAVLFWWAALEQEAT